MSRWLLVVLMALPLGCGTASKPLVAAEKTPAEGKPPKRFVELEPPDVAPPAPKPAPKAGQGNTELVLPHIRLTVPAAWVAKKPDVKFLMAEFTLPRAAGDPADGRVTVTMAGTGVKQTQAMWRDFFGGKPDKESQEEPQILGVWASLTDMSGTYRVRPSQSAPLESFPNYRMLALMCDVGVNDQMYFIKAVGPAKTIAAHEKEFRAFVGSIKLKQ